MAKVFITGSADGLGFLAAQDLIRNGHQVVLHARNEARKKETERKISGYESILVADVSDSEETKSLAEQVNALGKFDAIIHNAGIYNAPANNMFCVNVLAPYILTCLIEKPKRLIYLSSALHLSGHANFDIERVSYSDSKLFVVMLSKTIAKKWPEVFSNSVNPGWVPTKMGGKGAPDDLQKGWETQVWLATSNEEAAKVSGRYFFHKRQEHYNPLADDESLQNSLMDLCEKKTGVSVGK
jgi:NAD(P)-dependent dehydrogenase (short-subunit alcohol dehydrogenase family)